MRQWSDNYFAVKISIIDRDNVHKFPEKYFFTPLLEDLAFFGFGCTANVPLIFHVNPNITDIKCLTDVKCSNQNW